MNRMKSTYLQLLLLLSVAAVAQAKPVKVYLMGGQSNADGRTLTSTMPQEIQDYITNGGSRYCYWSYGDGTDEIWDKFGGRMTPFFPYTDFETQYCGFDAVIYNLIEKATRERFYVIKESQGGTAIDTRCASYKNLYWCADADWIQKASPRSGRSLTKEFTENIGLCIDNVLSKLSQGYEIQCIMWHQGESDRFRAADYGRNLHTMITYLRSYIVEKTGDVRYATLPFIAGTINRKSTQYNSTLEAEQNRLTELDPNFHLVDFSDCELGSDNLHFSGNGNVTCGRRMFNKLVSLGLVDADTVEVAEAPADTLWLTRKYIRNFDFDFFEDGGGIKLNDGSEQRDGRAPYGWQHTWQGYPETPFPASTNPPSFGITGTDMTYLSGSSACWYTPKGAMPADFELYQEIPAGELPPGRYRLSCLMGQNMARAGVTRLFANHHVAYFASESQYDVEALRQLYPDEVMTFAGQRGLRTTTLLDVSVEFDLQADEPLRFGIRSSNVSVRGAVYNGTGAFACDYWRLVRIGETTNLIPTLSKGEGEPAAVYDLSGRRVEKTRKGIFIINGKKVAVK